MSEQFEYYPESYDEGTGVTTHSTMNIQQSTQAEDLAMLAQILAAVNGLTARISAIERSATASPGVPVNVTNRARSRVSIGHTTPSTPTIDTQTLVNEYVIPEKHMLRMPEPKNKDEKPELPLKLVSWLYDN